MVWALIRPLVQLLLYYVVIGKFLGAERGIPNIAIYIFAGLTAYGLFNEIVSGATQAIVSNAGLIKKIYIPREVFPLASLGSALINFSIQLGLLLVAGAILGTISLSGLIYFVPSLLIVVVYGAALGILFSALNVMMRDVQYLVEVGLMLMMWASPVIYTWQMVSQVLGDGFLLKLYTWNPITLAVLGFQRAFWQGGGGVMAFPPNLGLSMLIAIIVGSLLILVCQQIFSKMQNNFAQYL